MLGMITKRVRILISSTSEDTLLYVIALFIKNIVIIILNCNVEVKALNVKFNQRRMIENIKSILNINT